MYKKHEPFSAFSKSANICVLFVLFFIFLQQSQASTSSIFVRGALGDSHVDWELSQPTAEGKGVKYFIERQLFSQMFGINNLTRNQNTKGFQLLEKNMPSFLLSNSSPTAYVPLWCPPAPPPQTLTCALWPCPSRSQTGLLFHQQVTQKPAWPQEPAEPGKYYHLSRR